MKYTKDFNFSGMTVFWGEITFYFIERNDTEYIWFHAVRGKTEQHNEYPLDIFLDNLNSGHIQIIDYSYEIY